MTGGKQKLRPWLEDMISKGEINGLSWLNEDKTKFRIPWKHGGKQDWSPDSSRIFMEWAKHTGKYRDGVDETNYPTWKTRLRCAFNKAPDIQEVREESQLNCHEPYRVYKLTKAKRSRSSLKLLEMKGQRVGNRAEGGRRGRIGSETDDVKVSSTQGQEYFSEDAYGSSGGLLPTVVAEFENSSPPHENLSPDLQSLFQCDLFESDSVQYMLANEIDCQSDGIYPTDEITGEPALLGNILKMESSGNKFLTMLQDDQSHSYDPQGIDCQFDGIHPTDEITGEPALLGNILKMDSSEDKFLTMLQDDQSHSYEPQDFQVSLGVFYCGQQVLETECNMRSGLRLAVSGCATSSAPNSDILPDAVAQLLSNDPETIYLPLSEGLISEKYKKLIDHLLIKSLFQGLLLWMTDEGDIFAYRFCPGAIYYNSQAETSGKSVKIQVNKTNPEFVKIFTNKCCFLNEGQPPEVRDPSVYLCCGQAPDLQDVPENVYICIKIKPSAVECQSYLIPIQETKKKKVPTATLR